jgi:recombination protein RecA
MGQGKENAREFLSENQDIAEEVQARLTAALGLGNAPEAEDADSEDGKDED